MYCCRYEIDGEWRLLQELLSCVLVSCVLVYSGSLCRTVSYGDLVLLLCARSVMIHCKQPMIVPRGQPHDLFSNKLRCTSASTSLTRMYSGYE